LDTNKKKPWDTVQTFDQSSTFTSGKKKRVMEGWSAMQKQSPKIVRINPKEGQEKISVAASRRSDGPVNYEHAGAVPTGSL
jgi:hypothetical protein